MTTPEPEVIAPPKIHGLDKLADTDRMGVIALYNQLRECCWDQPTIDHVMELLVSRTNTIGFFAEQCRTKETEIAALATRCAAAEAERNAWELSSTNWQADCRQAQSDLTAARAQVAAMEAAIHAVLQDATRDDKTDSKVETHLLHDLSAALPTPTETGR